jgi:hypothetical protein
VKSWYASTILEIQEMESFGRKYKNLFVGFRYYTEKGTKTEPDGTKFEGWSSKFDEWISINSPKICKLNTYSKPLTGNSKKTIKSYEEKLIDDT